MLWKLSIVFLKFQTNMDVTQLLKKEEVFDDQNEEDYSFHQPVSCKEERPLSRYVCNYPEMGA